MNIPPAQDLIFNLGILFITKGVIIDGAALLLVLLLLCIMQIGLLSAILEELTRLNIQMGVNLVASWMGHDCAVTGR